MLVWAKTRYCICMTAAAPRKTTKTVTTKPRAKGDVSLRQGSVLKSKPPTREECEKAYITLTSTLDLTVPENLEVGKMLFQGLLD